MDPNIGPLFIKAAIYGPESRTSGMHFDSRVSDAAGSHYAQGPDAKLLKDWQQRLPKKPRHPRH